MEWIKVSDRLPEIGDLCDICIDGRGRWCDYEFIEGNEFYNNELDNTIALEDHKITHWCLVIYPPRD